MHAPTTIAVSASMAICATQAMAALHGEPVVLTRDYEVPPEIEARIDAALARGSVRGTVNAVFHTLMQTYGDEDGLLAERYHDPGLQLASTNDSTTVPGFGCYGNCYGNCHTACHSACHGSRGWR